MVPRFAWTHPEAHVLWSAQASGNDGSARLFNKLKPAMLAAFERSDVRDRELEQLIERLISIAIWQCQGNAQEFELSTAEVKQALSIAPPAMRQSASAQLWRWMYADDWVPTDKSERWRTIIGPLFRDIWPLGAGLGSEDISRNLVNMACECERAFPDAVNLIMDFIVPYKLWYRAWLQPQEQYNDLIQRYPISLLRLTSALIDPSVYPVPDDLGELLDKCRNADTSVVEEPSYVRLYGLRRQRGA